MTEWGNRPLESVYPVMFIDAINVKIRDGQVANRPVYVAIGHLRRTRHPRTVGGDGGEGAKFWMSVLTGSKPRNQRLCIVVCDGLKGLPRPSLRYQDRTLVQTCVIHLLRNTFRYASRKYGTRSPEISGRSTPRRPSPRPRERFAEFAAKWATRYPAIIRLWENAWSEFIALPGLRPRDPTNHL